jgi:hypothetical protein
MGVSRKRDTSREGRLRKGERCEQAETNQKLGMRGASSGRETRAVKPEEGIGLLLGLGFALCANGRDMSGLRRTNAQQWHASLHGQ